MKISTEDKIWTYIVYIDAAYMIKVFVNEQLSLLEEQFPLLLRSRICCSHNAGLTRAAWKRHMHTIHFLDPLLALKNAYSLHGMRPAALIFSEAAAMTLSWNLHSFIAHKMSPPVCLVIHFCSRRRKKIELWGPPLHAAVNVSLFIYHPKQVKFPSIYVAPPNSSPLSF